MRDKAFYEEQIDHSPFFQIDPYQDPITYEREKNRLIESIFLYKTAESSENENYTVEIVEVFQDCIKYYDPDEGRFLHYFNVAFNRKIRIVYAEQMIGSQSTGIHFTKREKAASNRIYRFLQKHPEADSDEMQQLLSRYTEELEMNVEEIRDAIKIYRNSVSKSGDAVINGLAGSNMTLFDTLYSNYDFTEEISMQESILQLIDRCDDVYRQAREGSRELLSMKLTSLFAAGDRNEEYISFLRQKSFFNESIYEYVRRKDREITNAELCKRLKKTAPNITQIWNRFLKKLKA